MRLVFLSSGGGATAKAVYSVTKNRITSILGEKSSISVIADRVCGTTQWANKNNIPNKIISLDQDKSWSDLANCEEIKECDVIITTIHKIIPRCFVQAYNGKLINVHYSILPAFQGMIGRKTVQASMNYGSKLFGATCHYVTEEVDAGKPICQVAYAATSTDLDELTHRCFLSGCLALINGISLLAPSNSSNYSAGNIIHCDNDVYMSNPCHIDSQKALNFLSQNNKNKIGKN